MDSPFLIDRGGSIARKYGIDGHPAVVTLDPSGEVRWTRPVGGAGPDAVQAAARQALPNRLEDGSQGVNLAIQRVQDCARLSGWDRTTTLFRGPIP